MKFDPKTTTGSQLFNVPNNDEGKHFITLMRKYINHKVANTTVRGRGSRKEYAKIVGNYTAQDTLSKEYAEYFAIYVNTKKKQNKQQDNKYKFDIKQLYYSGWRVDL